MQLIQTYATSPLFLDLHFEHFVKIQPGFMVDAFDEFFKMTARLGQHDHPFDAMWLWFRENSTIDRTTLRGLKSCRDFSEQ